MFINSAIRNILLKNNISFIVKNHVSSTNDYLKYSYIRDQAPIVVLSNNQRNARGRRGKKWTSLQGFSLSFSLCLNLKGQLKNYFALSHLVGISIIEACEILGNNKLKIKWPNDIMEDDKKVCGVLIENLIDGKSSFYSMIGFGFNISIPDRFINFIDGCPGNISIENNHIDLLVGTTISTLLKNIKSFQEIGFVNFKKKWNIHMYGKDKNVILHYKNKEFYGKLIGINNHGELEIKTDKEIVSINDINYSMRLLK